MNRTIYKTGKPVSLSGRNIYINKYAPDFTAVDGNADDFRFSDLKDKIKIITSFSSLDTPICDLQLKRFNKEAENSADKIIIIGISNDLPFTQKKFCETNNIKKAIVLSDYKYSSFGINYGLLIKELNLLARAALIINQDNVIKYIQIANEISSHLDYDDAVINLKKIISDKTKINDLKIEKIKENPRKLTNDEIIEFINRNRSWISMENRSLKRTYNFNNYNDTKHFVRLLIQITNEQNHHADICVKYNKIDIELTTHKINALSNNDIIMAEIINELD